ncbi:MAG: hypothetical protein ABIH11_05540, partial [Candidatus Altiarchaeota archaeon]
CTQVLCCTRSDDSSGKFVRRWYYGGSGGDTVELGGVLFCSTGPPQPTTTSTTTTTSSTTTTISGSLRVAIECNTGSRNCNTPSETAYTIRSLLQGRGHTATIVDGSDIDTQAELEQYDVVIVGESGYGDNDFTVFQTPLKAWVRDGGGLVATAWVPYFIQGQGLSGQDLDDIIPVKPGTQYSNMASISITDSSHPVTEGLSGFNSPSFNNYGGGKEGGATILGIDGLGNPAVVVWTPVKGRAAYLSPNYYASHGAYNNEPLLDGSLSDARDLFIQSVEWAGGIR